MAIAAIGEGTWNIFWFLGLETLLDETRGGLSRMSWGKS